MNCLTELRALVCAITVLALHMPLAALAEERLDPEDPADAFTVWVKMNCSLEEGRDVLHWWAGRMYGRVQGEPDRHLFNVQGMNIRQCAVRRDPVRGLGIRWVSREVMFYLDPETDEVVREWQNPYTGENVEVIHVANDPVNTSDYLWANTEDGEPDPRWVNATVKDGIVLEGGGAARLFYENPLGGDYQEYVGGTYHAMEFGSTAAPLDVVSDPDTTEVQDLVISWGRVSKWLPWMEMGSRPGWAVFHTAGKRMQDWDSMPDVIREEIARNYPAYREPPPLDDDRPNETSWTVFKRHVDARRAAGGE